MGYDGKILRRALDRFEADKAARAQDFQRRREAVYQAVPRIREIDRELRSTMSQILSSALRRGADPGPAIRRIRDGNLSLQEEKRRLLTEHGYPADFLEEKPKCPICGDSGYNGSALCRCLRGYYAKEQLRELSQMLDLGNQSFDTFSLDWYAQTPDPQWGLSPRENMEAVYETCVHYASHFGKGSGNLLLSGAPGLGKTFLSAAIAREVSQRGFSVVYDTAGHVFSQFESRKFDRDEDGEAQAAVERCLRCDLMILDDLGTELTTAFTQSALYELINGRLLAGKPMVISTNLLLADLEKRYSPQIVSRLKGEYELLAFFGEDIRRLKRERG